MEFALADLPAGVHAVLAQRGSDAAILVSRALAPAERLAAVAHELHHLRRGGSGWQPGLPDPLRTVVAREEERVDRAVADDLLPLHALAALARRRVEVEGCMSAVEVADEFGVPVSVAERQIRRLA